MTINELIKKYEDKLAKLTLLRGIDEKCQIHNTKSYAKAEAYQEILQDLKALKEQHVEILKIVSNSSYDTAYNEFKRKFIELIGGDINE